MGHKMIVLGEASGYGSKGRDSDELFYSLPRSDNVDAQHNSSRLGIDDLPDIDVTFDSTFLSLVNSEQRQALEYGDPESKAEALRVCSRNAFRKIGLPEKMGDFVDLLTDAPFVHFLKDEIESGIAHDTQDTNSWERRNNAARELFKKKYAQPEDRDTLRTILGIAFGDWVQRGEAGLASLKDF